MIQQRRDEGDSAVGIVRAIQMPFRAVNPHIQLTAPGGVIIAGEAVVALRAGAIRHGGGKPLGPGARGQHIHGGVAEIEIGRGFVDLLGIDGQGRAGVILVGGIGVHRAGEIEIPDRRGGGRLGLIDEVYHGIGQIAGLPLQHGIVDGGVLKWRFRLAVLHHQAAVAQPQDAAGHSAFGGEIFALLKGAAEHDDARQMVVPFHGEGVIRGVLAEGIVHGADDAVLGGVIHIVPHQLGLAGARAGGGGDPEGKVGPLRGGLQGDILHGLGQAVHPGEDLGFGFGGHAGVCLVRRGNGHDGGLIHAGRQMVKNGCGGIGRACGAVAVGGVAEGDPVKILAPFQQQQLGHHLNIEGCGYGSADGFAQPDGGHHIGGHPHGQGGQALYPHPRAGPQLHQNAQRQAGAVIQLYVAHAGPVGFQPQGKGHAQGKLEIHAHEAGQRADIEGQGVFALERRLHPGLALQSHPLIAFPDTALQGGKEGNRRLGFAKEFGLGSCACVLIHLVFHGVGVPLGLLIRIVQAQELIPLVFLLPVQRIADKAFAIGQLKEPAGIHQHRNLHKRQP